MLCHNFHFMFSFYAMSRDNVRIRPWCGNAFTFASCSSVFASFWVLPSTSYSVLNLTYSVLNLTWPKLDANVSSSHQYLNVFVTWNTVSSIIIRDVTHLQQGLVSRWVTSLPRLCVTAVTNFRVLSFVLTAPFSLNLLEKNLTAISMQFLLPALIMSTVLLETFTVNPSLRFHWPSF